ncbi:hypothetical protein BLNAU_20611 [Blattamonas nauphoetae]|uniref:Uncharacterized protein n=1 Tax=Blattamonas nauphoetae TaxID=2049346 RepID=A0ABQ9WYR4_9EUKA|nr:hypothetical protein BLNAU_20611 [Blattamonas nauphoetae]
MNDGRGTKVTIKHTIINFTRSLLEPSSFTLVPFLQINAGVLWALFDSDICSPVLVWGENDRREIPRRLLLAIYEFQERCAKLGRDWVEKNKSYNPFLAQLLRSVFPNHSNSSTVFSESSQPCILLSSQLASSTLQNQLLSTLFPPVSASFTSTLLHPPLDLFRPSAAFHSINTNLSSAVSHFLFKSFNLDSLLVESQKACSSLIVETHRLLAKAGQEEIDRLKKSSEGESNGKASTLGSLNVILRLLRCMSLLYPSTRTAMGDMPFSELIEFSQTVLRTIGKSEIVLARQCTHLLGDPLLLLSLFTILPHLLSLFTHHNIPQRINRRFSSPTYTPSVVNSSLTVLISLSSARLILSNLGYILSLFAVHPSFPLSIGRHAIDLPQERVERKKKAEANQKQLDAFEESLFVPFASDTLDTMSDSTKLDHVRRIIRKRISDLPSSLEQNPLFSEIERQMESELLVFLQNKIDRKKHTSKIERMMASDQKNKLSQHISHSNHDSRSEPETRQLSVARETVTDRKGAESAITTDTPTRWVVVSSPITLHSKMPEAEKSPLVNNLACLCERCQRGRHVCSHTRTPCSPLDRQLSPNVVLPSLRIGGETISSSQSISDLVYETKSGRGSEFGGAHGNGRGRHLMSLFSLFQLSVKEEDVQTEKADNKPTGRMTHTFEPTGRRTMETEDPDADEIVMFLVEILERMLNAHGPTEDPLFNPHTVTNPPPVKDTLHFISRLLPSSSDAIRSGMTLETDCLMAYCIVLNLKAMLLQSTETKNTDSVQKKQIEEEWEEEALAFTTVEMLLDEKGTPLKEDPERVAQAKLAQTKPCPTSFFESSQRLSIQQTLSVSFASFISMAATLLDDISFDPFISMLWTKSVLLLCLPPSLIGALFVCNTDPHSDTSSSTPAVHTLVAHPLPLLPPSPPLLHTVQPHSLTLVPQPSLLELHRKHEPDTEDSVPSVPERLRAGTEIAVHDGLRASGLSPSLPITRFFSSHTQDSMLSSSLPLIPIFLHSHSHPVQIRSTTNNANDLSLRSIHTTS